MQRKKCNRPRMVSLTFFDKDFCMSLNKILLVSFLCLLPLSVYASSETTHDLPKTAAHGTVALTFDDGPTDVYTPQILAILKKYNIKATFFMVGMNAEAHPEIVKQVLAEGHAINSHSQTHPMLTKLNDEQLHKEVYEPSAIIYKITGKKPVCLRYPFGASNSHVREYIRAAGMTPTPMGFNSFDYDRPGTEKIVSWIIKNAHSGQVILLHDGFAKREETVAALSRIIEGIQKKGLGFSQVCTNG